MDSLTLWLTMMCLIFAALAFNFWRDARLWRERAKWWSNHAETLNAECTDLFQTNRRLAKGEGEKEKSDG